MYGGIKPTHEETSCHLLEENIPINFRRLAKLGARANSMSALIAAHLLLTPGELLVERGRRSMYATSESYEKLNTDEKRV